MVSIAYKDVKDGPRTVVISGRLDAAGVAAVEGRLGTCCAASERLVIVNLRTVSFLASQGIRCLLVNAKTAAAHGSQLALLVEEGSSVQSSIRASGINQIIPTFTCPVALQEALLA